MPSEPVADRSDRHTLLALLVAIVLAGAVLSFDTPLVVKLTEFYRISDSDFGLLLGLTTAVMAAASGLWGYWADKYPRLRLILVSEVIIAVSMVVAGLCLQWRLPYAVFFAVKLASGFGLAGVGPVAQSAIMDTVPLPQRGAAFGRVGVAWVVGGAAGMLLPSVCMQVKLGLGWTYLLGAAGTVLFIATLFLVAEPRRGAQDQALKDTVGAGTAEYRRHIHFSDLKPLLTRPANLLIMAATVFFQFPPQVLAVWFVTFLMRNHGLNEFIATQAMFLAFLGQPFGNVLGGYWTDRAFLRHRTGRLTVMILMAALAPVFLSGAMIAPFRWIYFLPLMVLANFFLVASGPGLTTVGMEANLPEHRGTISALMGVCSNGVRALAWYLPPLVAERFHGRYDRTFLIVAGAYVPLILTYILMKARIEADLDDIDRVLAERAKDL